MFENIVGHKNTITILREEIVGKRFPRAVLISGPRYVGKLSIALEIARALSCDRKGSWTCNCSRCLQHRDLRFPYLILMGWRYSGLEISAARELLYRFESVATYYFYVRAVRKLVRRYDQILWEGEERKLRPVSGMVRDLNEHLEVLTPSIPYEQIRTISDKIQAQVDKIVTSLKTENVPISQIRNVKDWLHVHSSQGRKVVIIEHAEGIETSSRNALLRVLEEPPAETNLILLARSADSLIPTIRSRIREYALKERPLKEQKEVLRRVFHLKDPELESVQDFFLGLQNIGTDLLEKQVASFVVAVADSVSQRGKWINGPPGGFINAIGMSERLEREQLRLFLEQLSEKLRRDLREGQSSFTLQAWFKAIERCMRQVVVFHVQPRHALQALGTTLVRIAVADTTSTGEQTL